MKLLALLFTSILHLKLSISPIHAATSPLSDIYEPAGPLGGSGATLGRLISPLIQNATILFSLVAFFSTLLAGFNYITSQGDKAKVQQATNMLNYSLLGLVLAVSAFVITQIVGTIGGFDFMNPGI